MPNGNQKTENKRPKTVPDFDISKEKNFELYKDFFDRIAQFDRQKDAYNLIKALPVMLEEHPQLEQKNPEMYRTYQQMITRAKVFAFSFLDNNEIENFFEKNLALIFKYPWIDFLEDKIKAKLIAVLMHNERDELKKRWREAMLKNEQLLTSKKIIYEDRKEEPTIGNWLRNYMRVMGGGKVDKLKQAEYIVNSSQTRYLSEDDREKLKEIIRIFDFLKRSSTTMEGLEEAVSVYLDDKLMVLKNGKLEDISKFKDTKAGRILQAALEIAEEGAAPPEEEEAEKEEEEKARRGESEQVRKGEGEKEEKKEEEVKKEKKEEGEKKEEPKPAPSVKPDREIKKKKKIPVATSESTFVSPATIEEQIMKAFRGSQEERERVKKAEDQAVKKTNKDYKKLRDYLKSALEPKGSQPIDEYKVFAALRLLAKIGRLDDLLKDDKRFFDMLVENFKEKGKQDMAQAFKLSPKSPPYLSSFLKMVFSEKLKMDKNNSARWASQLASFLRPFEGDKYARLAYFDVEEKKFKWGM